MSNALRTQRGITLIELMVGMVIGLLVTLVVAQVATVYEGRKRTISNGSDVQVNGSLALQALQRDILSAGYGFTSGGVTGCTQIRAKFGSTNYDWTMAPVLITQGSGGTATVSGGPDAIRVLMSSNSNFAVPIRIAENHRHDDTGFVLDPRTNVGNRLGDLLLVVPGAGNPTQASPSPSSQVSPNWCSIANISSTPTGDRLEHATGVNGPWNQDATATRFPGTLGSDIAYAAGSYLVNLGTMTDRAYWIPQPVDADYATYPGNSLLMRTLATSAPASPTTAPLFSQIVTIQAVYGLDADGDRTIETWTTTSPSTAAGWSTLLAVRVAVVSRSSQYEKEAVTTVEPTWRWNGIDSQTLSIAGYVPCDTGDANCWQHYRYRVFEAVIPLRNMLWKS